jgi:hypothetical protein
LQLLAFRKIKLNEFFIETINTKVNEASWEERYPPVTTYKACNIYVKLAIHLSLEEIIFKKYIYLSKLVAPMVTLTIDTLVRIYLAKLRISKSKFWHI